jgi:ribosome recycling factor
VIEIAFSEGDVKGFETPLKNYMEAPIKHFEKELATLRTGRASVALIEHLKVNCYGQFMSLKEVASLATPDSRLLTVQPWDKTIIGEIEKAIATSDLGATPINDGTIIRIQLPQMSSARRDELSKLLNKKAEECKIAIRNIRKDFHNEVRDADKKHIISEDFAKKLSEVLQKITDQYIEKAEKMTEKKNTELHTL